MTRPLHFVIVADGDARLASTWSGTAKSMTDALAERVQVTVIADRWPEWYYLVGRAAKYLSFKRFDYVWTPWFARIASRRLKKRIAKISPDAIITIALTDVAYAITDVAPLVYVTDASWVDLIHYYDMFRRVAEPSKRKAIALERQAIESSLVLLVPSKWAHDAFAIKQSIETDRIMIAPWAPNLLSAESYSARTVEDRPIRFLFVGKDWRRKGLMDAVEIVSELRMQGVDCRLDIVADVNESFVRADHLTVHGSLYPSDPVQAAQLAELWSRAHFFLMPSHAEAYGIVFAEAARAGLPSIAYATGGITTVVRDGVTGLLLPEGSDPADFVAPIRALVDDGARYRRMSQSAIDWAESTLTWSRWAESVVADIERRLARLDVPERGSKA